MNAVNPGVVVTEIHKRGRMNVMRTHNLEHSKQTHHGDELVRRAKSPHWFSSRFRNRPGGSLGQLIRLTAVELKPAQGRTLPMEKN